jgi:hypothetical protein
MMILTMGCVAGAGVECDFEDGEFEFDLPDIDFVDGYYDGYHDDYYYEEVYYYDDWWYPCCY